MPKHSSTERGRAAEDLALQHLQGHGLRLIERNWLCRLGELDLVMIDGDTVVFIEVRYRQYQAWGGPLESVDARKREKLSNAANAFLQQHSRWQRHPCRFDVIAIQPAGNTPTLEWITNAFDA